MLALIQRAAVCTEVAVCSEGAKLDLEVQGGKVLWVAPKRLKRAIKKAVLSYGNDISLLTYLARQALVYKTSEQLAFGMSGP